MFCPDDPPVAASNAAGWWLLALVAAVIVIDVALARTGRPTMSQWVKRHTRRWRWWKAFGVGLIAVTLWHLLLGGPI
jgi:hypothetical protein